jgi:IS1 family transposase
MEQYEDDGTWIWVSFAPEYRMIIAHQVGARKQYMADWIIEKTAERISTKPLFVSDGLKFYTKALLKKYSKLVEFTPTGKRGRPQIPKLVPDPDLKYAQVVKRRKGGRLHGVEKRILFGTDVDSSQISTSLIERQNLTFRQDNNRISRKTIGFSKEQKYLDCQMTLYSANFNFCRGHGSLTYLDEQGIKRKNSPAKECGLIDHNWTLREMLTFPHHNTSTN